MFTRQHYKAIAEIVKKNTDRHDHPQFNYWDAMGTDDFCDELADYFAADNPRFDRTKFLEACGL